MSFKTAYIKRRNFTAKLPKDYVHLYRLSKEGIFLLYSDNIQFKTWRQAWDNTYCVHEDRILFAGKFSKFWMIRIFQKAFDWLFPKIYKLEYENYNG